MTRPDRGTISLAQFMPHPAGRVWQALTDPAELGRWFMPNDFAPVVGHTFRFRRSHSNPAVRFSESILCQVLEVLTEESLSYSWTDAAYPGELDTVVTWTLSPEGRGIRLFLEHRGFVMDDPIQQEACEIMDDGWRIYVAERLAVHTRTPA
jgi:uncharacterized protein YndB with AHSA1/START domain